MSGSGGATQKKQMLGDWKPPILDVKRGERFIPGIAGSIPGGDFGSMVDSASGDITAPVWAADLTIPSPAADTSTSGCEVADFAGMPQGAIVIVQRGFCGDLTKMLNAQAAGAGAIIYRRESSSHKVPLGGGGLCRSASTRVGDPKTLRSAPAAVVARADSRV